MPIPTAHGTFEMSIFESTLDGAHHVVLSMGAIAGAADVLVRVHSECLTGDIFGSLRCDCGDQLDAAMRRIAAAGQGVIVYLRGHEGRGIGLSHKLARLRPAGPGARHASTPTWRWGCRPTTASSAPAPRSWPSSA